MVRAMKERKRERGREGRANFSLGGNRNSFRSQMRLELNLPVQQFCACGANPVSGSL